MGDTGKARSARRAVRDCKPSQGARKRALTKPVLQLYKNDGSAPRAALLKRRALEAELAAEPARRAMKEAIEAGACAAAGMHRSISLELLELFFFFLRVA